MTAGGGESMSGIFTAFTFLLKELTFLVSYIKTMRFPSR